jgi:hypothetical protein
VQDAKRIYMASRAGKDDKRSKGKKSVRAHKLLAFFARLAYTSPGKKCDKQLTHIVRVTGCCYFPFEVRKLILSHVF